MKTYLPLIPAVAAALSGCSTLGQDASLVGPRIDYHQHLVSAAFEPVVKMPRRDGATLIRELDAAGIQRAVVLSVGYTYGDERKGFADPDRLTREENDWTSVQVAANAQRLIGFCSANPLRDAALGEIERCLGLPGMAGIKVHMGNAGVSFRNPAHLIRMQHLLALAEKRRVPVLIHMRARGGTDYGAQDAKLFLDHIVPMAPSVEVVIAHLGASSPGYPAQNDEVMAVFGEAARQRDPRMRNIYFDVSANVTEEMTPEQGAQLAQRLRQVGLRRILYGSDLSAPGGSIRAGWEIFRDRSGLTPTEIRLVFNNRTRFVR
jgi:predicted TIM-barrel fold metal-dependent hydrolase